MTLPASATKVHLDAATDDPKQARSELAALVDKFNDLLTHMTGSTILSTPLGAGQGLESDGAGGLRVKLNGTTLTLGSSGIAAAAASETQAGVAEIATQNEVNIGTDDARMLTPKKLAEISPTSVTFDTAADQVLILDGSDSSKLKRASLPSISVPAGSVVDYAGSTAPSGWLFCAGQAVSRSTYAGLFSAISTTFGVGDGSTTFNLPDLRGRVAAGKDNMGGTAANRLTSGGSGITGTTLGASGGTQTHTLSTSEMPAHLHTGGPTLISGAGSDISTLSSGTGNTGSTGGGGAHQNTQPTLILNKIIKT